MGEPHPLPQASERTLLVVVEVPKGCQNKYEYDPRSGRMVLDRVLYSPVYYPGEYGFVPETLAEDGDPLDALVISTVATFPGCAIPVRLLGVLEMTDDKGVDAKLLGVVSVDPRFQEIRSLAAVPQHVLREVEHFFRVYKELEGKPCVIQGWRDAATAWRLVEEARSRYLATAAHPAGLPAAAGSRDGLQ